jgi:hypothetical protein
MEPLDPNLNAAITAIAKRLFPSGFDVSDDAPDTYKKLKTHLDAGKRLVVFSGGSQHTIYADPAVNHAFRAWHDWTHWTGQHDLTFQGELAVYDAQRKHLIELFGDNSRTRYWSEIINAEIIGQATYFEYHKRFPVDQRGFVEAYLKDPHLALTYSLF